MKRVIDGKTYNTDTATLVAKYEYQDHKNNDVEAKVFVNNGGALFVLHSWDVENNTKHYMEALTRSELDKLVSTMDNIEIIDEEALEAPPEASAEAEPGATIYVRVPSTLKRRVDEAARDAKLSGNAYALRCMEACLKSIEDYPELMYIRTISSAVQGDLPDWSIDKYQKALADIFEYAERLANDLFGADKFTDADGSMFDDVVVKNLREEYSVPIRLTQTPTRASVGHHGDHGHPAAQRSGFSPVAP
jgi:hypothetical protein